MATMKIYILSGLILTALIFAIIWLFKGSFVTFYVSPQCPSPTPPWVNRTTPPPPCSYQIKVEQTVSEMAFNLVGIVLLNVCLVIGQVYHLYHLQNMDDTFMDKPVIFLLQQTLFMQLFSFITMNVLYYELFLADGIPFHHFTSAVFNVISASVMSESILLTLYVFARALVMYRARAQGNNGQLRFLIAFKAFAFILVNVIVFSITLLYGGAPQDGYLFTIDFVLPYNIQILLPICFLVLFVTSTFQLTKWRNIKSLHWLVIFYIAVIHFAYTCGLSAFLSEYIGKLYPVSCVTESECKSKIHFLNLQLNFVELRLILALLSLAPLCNNLWILYSPSFVRFFITRHCCRVEAQNELRQPLLNPEDHEPNIANNDVHNGQHRPQEAHGQPQESQKVYQQEPPQQNVNQQEPLQQNINQQGPLQQNINQQGPLQQNINQQGPPQQNINQQGPPQQNINQQEPLQQNINQQGPLRQNINQQGPPQQNINQQGPPQQNINQQEPSLQNINQQEPPQQNINQQKPPQQNINQQEPPPPQQNINKQEPPLQKKEHNAHAPRFEPSQQPPSYPVPKKTIHCEAETQIDDPSSDSHSTV
eukprot:TCONS_00027306-protein